METKYDLYFVQENFTDDGDYVDSDLLLIKDNMNKEQMITEIQFLNPMDRYQYKVTWRYLAKDGYHSNEFQISDEWLEDNQTD